ncbi:hypothetical protein LPJ73_001061, partial [Coemansia sp. RSA 2703]
MVLTPIRRSAVPSPLTDARGFDEFATQFLNKCDDLLASTQRFPVTKRTEHTTVRRQNRSPHEAHRWLRRDTPLRCSYDDVRHVLFTQRAEHLPQWVPQLSSAECIESIVPNLCAVYRLAFRAQGMRAKRDYCQLVVMRELVGERARPRPRVFTPSASMANLAMLAVRSQSSTNLAVNTAGLRGDWAPGSGPGSPTSPVSAPLPPLHKGMRSARSALNLHDPPSPAYAGLTPPLPHQFDQYDQDDDGVVAQDRQIVRRFQVVSVPLLHPQCTPQRGHVRAVYEAYEEVREFSDGSVEWSCVHHADLDGWLPRVVADKAVAAAVPREADALV